MDGGGLAAKVVLGGLNNTGDGGDVDDSAGGVGKRRS